MDFGAVVDVEAMAEWPLPVRLRAAHALLAGTFEQVAGQEDAELVEGFQVAEVLGDLADGLRVRFTGEVERRSEPTLGDERLSARYGCRNGFELLSRLSQSKGKEIGVRRRLDAATRTSATLTGQPVEAKFPIVAQALRDGVLGVDAAALITSKLGKTIRRAHPEDVATAEQALVDAATGRVDASDTDTPTDTDNAPGTDDPEDPAGPDNPDHFAGTDEPDGPDPLHPVVGRGGPRPTFRDLAQVVDLWVAAVDPDGPEPGLDEQMKQRGITLVTRRDGLIEIKGVVTAELAAVLTRLWAAHLNPAASKNTASDGDSTDGAAQNTGTTLAAGAGAGGEFVVEDKRTPQQRRHDVLAAALGAAGRCAETPTLGGDNAVLMVHVNAEDLDEAEAPVVLDGIDVPGSMESVYRLSCTSAVQKVVFDGTSKVVALGTKERVFNAHQRRAIMARDGECIIPGCTIPGAWCEIHHVIPWAEGGETHVDNGVLLCWWHHHTIETTDWDIDLVGGTPRVKAPEWIDPTGAYRVPPNTITRPRGPYLPPREHSGPPGTREQRRGHDNDPPGQAADAA